MAGNSNADIYRAKMNAWDDELRRKNEYYLNLYNSGKTSSGRPLGDTLSMPKNAGESYNSYLGKYRAIMAGKNDFDNIQSARKDAFYARNYLQNGQEGYDAEYGVGATQTMLDYLEASLAEINGAQDRRFSEERKAQSVENQRLYEIQKRRKDSKEKQRQERLAVEQSARDLAAERIMRNADAVAQRSTVDEKIRQAARAAAAARLPRADSSNPDYNQFAKESAAYGMTPEQYARYQQDNAIALPGATQLRTGAQVTGKSMAEEKLRQAALEATATTLPKADSSNPNYNQFIQEAAERGMTPAQYARFEQDRTVAKPGATQLQADIRTPNQLQAYEPKTVNHYAEYDNGPGFADVAARYKEKAAKDVKNMTGKDANILYGVLYPEMSSPFLNGELVSADALLFHEMSPHERDRYFYIASEHGLPNATEYFETLLKQPDKRYGQKAYEIRDTALREEANQNPAMATISSVLATPGRLAGTVDSYVKKARGEAIDPYGNLFAINQWVNTPRDQIAQNIDGAIKNDTLKWLAKAVYSAGTSSADSFLTALLAPGSAWAATALMGASAASDSIQDAKFRGGTDDQAILLGTITAMIETATEYLPMDNMMRAFETKDAIGIKGILKKALIGGIEEAPGESASELFGGMADDYIMEEISQYNLSVQGYIHQGMGEEEAKRKATAEKTEEILTAGFVGFLSGGASSGTAAAGSAIRNRLDSGLGMTEQPNTPQTDFDAMLRDQAGQVAEREAGLAQSRGEAAQQEINAKKPQGAGSQQQNPGSGLQGAAAISVSPDGAAGEPVTVTGVNSVEKGRVYFDVQNQDGSTGVMSDMDVDFADADRAELMASGVAARMDARGAGELLGGYDAGLATPEQYAREFGGIYERAKVGMQFDGAAIQSDRAQAYLTYAAQRAAFDAGAAMYAEKTNPQAIADLKTNGQAVAYSLNPKFEQEYDAWDQKRSDIRFKIGTTSKALQAIGVKDTKIIWDSSKIQKIKQKHPEMTDAVIKQVPSILENPVVVMQSLQGDSRVTMFGEVKGENGKPVLAVLELEPTNREGLKINEIKLASAYGKDNAQSLIDRSKLLYVDANKNRTNDWLRVNRLQLPLLEDQYGSINKLSYSNAPVKNKIRNAAGKNAKAAKGERYERGADRASKPGKLIEKYSSDAFDRFGSNERKRQAKAEMAALRMLAKKTGRTIRVVDTIDVGREGKDGTIRMGKANATYNKGTGNITIALDAIDGAYLYVGMHELTHALKHEHAKEWPAFEQFVLDALTARGMKVEQLVRYQMEAHGYSRAAALEEVVCNSVPAVLMEEANIRKLLEMDRTLFERVMDWLREFVDGLREIGETLMHNAGWLQMQALRNDGAALEGIYDRMMEVLADTGKEKKSKKKSSNDVAAPAMYSEKERGSNTTEKHSPEMLKIMKEYEDAVDERLLRTAKMYKLDKNAQHMRVKVADVSTRMAKEIRELIGIDVSDYTVNIDRSGFTHIEKRHGENGEHDHSMADLKDVARIGYIVDHYDSIEWLVDQNGKRVYSGQYKDKDGNQAPILLIKKRVNGTYYVSEAVADNAWKKIWVQTAYKQKAEVTSDAESGTMPPSLRPRRLPSSPSADTSISQPQSDMQDGENTDEPMKFSLRETDENVQSELNTLQAALDLTRGHRITAAEADRLAGKMLQKTNSSYDRETLAREIAEIYDYAERAEQPSMEQIDDEQTALLARVLEKSSMLDMEHEETAKPVREYLRKTPVRLTESQQAEAEYLTGSGAAFRRALFGRARLSQQATSTLDQLWPELHDMAPQWFPEDANEGDMPRMLLEAVDAMKPVYRTEQGFGMEEAAQYMAGEMNSAYLALPGVKAAAKEQRKLGMTAEEYRKAHTAFAEASQAAFESALGEMDAARTRQNRTEQQRRAAALREKYRKWREQDTAKRKERENRTRYTQRIEQNARAMLALLENPTEKRHIHEDLVAVVKNFVAALHFDKGTKEQAALRRRIGDLAGAVRKIESGDYNKNGASYELPPGLVSGLEDLAHRAGELGGIAEMPEQDLRELSQWTAAVRHAIQTANELHAQNRSMSLTAAGEGTISELGKRKTVAQRTGVLRMTDELLNSGMVDAGHFFERLGGKAQKLYQALRDGFDTQIRCIDEAGRFMRDAKDGMDTAKLSGKRAEKQAFEVSGGELTLTKAQVMELYLLSKRKQAKGHLYERGVLAEGAGVEPVRVTARDVKAITETLSREEKTLADKMQRFLAKNCAAWGNTASMELYGVRLFGEPDYWPIRVDKNTVDTRNDNPTDGNADSGFYAIKNMGMTKAVQEGAGNPLMIGDVFDTFTRHADQMSRYAGYLLPVTDMMRWYNYRGGEYGVSVKRSIEKVFGAKGKRYIEQFIRDVNGATVRDYSSGIFQKMSRNAKVAAVGANLRVVVQQPTAYARAAAEMSPKYLAMGLGGKPMIEQAKQYCPIALWKSWGFFDINTGKSMRQMIVGDATMMDKAREVGTALAGKADEVTWGYLFRACCAEQQAMHPELAPKRVSRANRGTEVGRSPMNAEAQSPEGFGPQQIETLYELAGKRLSEIVDKTQVVDSVFHRTEQMRSKSGVEQMYTAFMSEPMKTYNMLRSAIADYAQDRKNPVKRAKLARVLGTYVITGVLTSAAAAIVDAMRSGDEDKDWWEKYLAALLGDYGDAENAGDYIGTALAGNLGDNLNPLGMIPYVKDIVGMLQGYDPSRLDMQSIQRIVDVVGQVDQLIKGESQWSAYKTAYQIGSAVGSFFGLPLGNGIRDLNALYQTVTGRMTPTMSEAANMGMAGKNLYEAMRNGDREDQKRLREKMAAKGKSPSEIDAAIANVLREKDPRVAQAWAAKAAGRATEVKRLRSAMVADGMTGEMVDKAITSYGASLAEKAEKDMSKELKVSLYTAEDMAAVMKCVAGIGKGEGSLADVRAMYSEMVGDSKAKDPAKSVQSSVMSLLKKDYVALIDKGDDRGRMALQQVMEEVLGVTEAQLAESVADAYRERVIELYLSGDDAGVDDVLYKLEGLELYDEKGRPYFTQKRVDGWIEAEMKKEFGKETAI